MKVVINIVSIVLILIVSSCSHIVCDLEGQQQRFERHKTAAIGMQVDSKYFRQYVGKPHSIVDLGDGTFAYLFEQVAVNGTCRWEGKIDSTTLKMLSWHIVGSNEHCVRQCRQPTN